MADRACKNLKREKMEDGRWRQQEEEEERETIDLVEQTAASVTKELKMCPGKSPMCVVIIACATTVASSTDPQAK